MKEFIIISDLHAGSRYSISPTPKGPVQQALRKMWREMLDTTSTISDLHGINLGDNCDGRDRKGSGQYNTTNDIMEQIGIAETLLNEINAKDWCFVQGSYYHTDQNVSSDQLLAYIMKGQFGNELVVKSDGQRLHCSHAVGVSMASPAYRTTPIARELMLAAINEKEYGKFNLIMRGHAHYFCRVSFGGSHGIICPCWKGRDTFAQTRTLAMMPHIGYVLLKVENDGITIEPHIYSLKGKELVTEVTV
jgi:hypothetical protein